MTAQARQGQAGFTLAEVMVALALTLILAIGLYGIGLMAMKMTAFNRISMEARALGMQSLEEVSARTVPEIALQVPYPVRTNVLQRGEQVVRTVEVVGHDAGMAVTTNLAASAYMEVHVNVRFKSPLTDAPVTNTFSTLVN